MFCSICRVRQRVKSLSKINSQQSLFYFSFLQHSERPYSELDWIRQAVLYPFVCKIEKFLSTLSLKIGKGRAENGRWIWYPSASEAGTAPRGDNCSSQKSSSRNWQLTLQGELPTNFSPDKRKYPQGCEFRHGSCGFYKFSCNYPTHETWRHQFWFISVLSEVSHTALLWVTDRTFSFSFFEGVTVNPGWKCWIPLLPCSSAEGNTAPNFSVTNENRHALWRCSVAGISSGFGW